MAQLEAQQEGSLSALQQATAALRSSREADLAVIERALSAAQDNQEQTDHALKAAVASLREVDRRLGAVAAQNEASVGDIENLGHRVAVLQRALMETTKGVIDGFRPETLSPSQSVTSSMRHGRRSPRGTPAAVSGD